MTSVFKQVWAVRNDPAKLQRMLTRLLTAKALLSMHGLLTDRERTAIERRIARRAMR